MRSTPPPTAPLTTTPNAASARLRGILDEVTARNPAEPEFHQAVREVLDTLGPVVSKHPEFADHKIVQRLCETERQILFRVPGRRPR